MMIFASYSENNLPGMKFLICKRILLTTYIEFSGFCLIFTIIKK